MSSILPGTKSLESPISICIPALLTLIAAVILGAQIPPALLNLAGIKALSAAESYNPYNLYDMTGPDNAFSVYSRERRSEAARKLT